MKKITLIALSLVAQTALSQKMIVGKDTISIENFKKEQLNTLLKEGVTVAINNAENFALLQQFAQEKKADTMTYFRTRMSQKVAELEDQHFYPKTMVENLLKKYVDASKTDRNILVFNIEKKSGDTTNYNEIYNSVVAGKMTMENAIKTYTKQEARAIYIKPGVIFPEMYDELLTLPVGGYTRIHDGSGFITFAKLVSTRPSLGYMVFGTLAYPKDDNSPKMRQEILDALQSGKEFNEVTAQFGTSDNEKNNGGVVLGSPLLPDEVYKHLKNATIGNTAGPILLDDKYYFFHIYDSVPYELNETTRPLFKREMMNSNFLSVLNNQFTNSLRQKPTYKQTAEFGTALSSYQSLQNMTDETAVLYTYNGISMTVGMIKKQLDSRFKNLEQIPAKDWKLLMETLRDDFLMASYIAEFANVPEVKNELDSYRKVLYSEFIFTHYLKKLIDDNPKWTDDYYNQNKPKYQWLDRAKVRVAIVADDKIIKDIEEQIKDANNWQNLISKYENQLNDKEQIRVHFQEGFLEKNAELFTKYKVSFKKGIHTTKVDGRTVVLAVDELLPPQTMTKEEAKIQLMSDLTEVKLKELIAEQKAKTNIEIPEAFRSELERNFKK